MTDRLRFSQIGSTQIEALALARAGAPTGTTIIAERQDHGAGRLDHAWYSPPGGLYLSRIERDPAGAVELVPMAVANGLADWMEQHLEVATTVRWPNDLWVRSPAGKLAGILADRVDTPGGTRLIVGIGVNVALKRADLPASLAGTVAILRERTRREVSMGEVEEAAVRAVQGALETVERPEGVRALVHALERRLDGIGGPAELDGVPVGTVRGLHRSGGLVTELAGVRSIHRAGTLRLGGPKGRGPPEGEGSGLHKRIKVDPGPRAGAGTG